MSTVYGVNRTLKEAGAVNSIEPELMGNKVKWVFEEYEAAALASGSVIELFGLDIPAEARIVDWIIDHDALADVTVALGTKASDAVFMAQASVASAAKKTYSSNGVASSLGYEIASGDGQTLILTTTGASAATGTIKVAVAFVPKG